MKKLFMAALFAGLIGFSACGPSAEERAASEKRMQDSLAMVQQDSMARAMADSMAMMQQQMMDSMRMKAMADSMAMMKSKMNRPATKPKTNQQKIEEDRKSLQKEKG